MNRRTQRAILRMLFAVPGLYPLVAFLTGRRVAVRGRSMEPTLLPGERVIFDRLAYTVRHPRRGDVVLARHPARPGLTLIKRVAAVPGDRIPLSSSASASDRREGMARMSRPPGWHGVDVPSQTDGRTLASGEYFLLGDNAAFSTDSRELGPVRRRDIRARAWLVYWPPERFRRL